MNTLFNSAKSILLLLVFSFTILGCTNETALDLSEETLNKSSSNDSNELSARKGNKLHFNASLKGRNEVPPVATKAAGETIVTISKDETKIRYKLITANIVDVFGAHFHLAPAGSNGGVVAFLYNDAPSGPANGVLAEGYITAGDVIGSIAGDLDALIDAIRNGYIYVNVHTTSTPSGEIRGQL